MSSDSDESEIIAPSSIRPSIRRDIGIAARATSPIVTAAARRQLRGNKGSDKKSPAEVAAEYRRKEMEEAAKDMGQTPPMGGVAGLQAEGGLSSMPLDGLDLEDAGSLSHTGVAPMARLVQIKRKAISLGPGQGSPAHPSGNVGIGVKFTQSDKGENLVTSLLPGGPADDTKQVHVGDKIVAVDGVSLEGKSSDEVINLILGPPDTIVEMMLQETKLLALEKESVAANQNGLPASMSSQAQTQKSPDPVPSQAAAHSPSDSAAGSAQRGGVGIKFGMDKNQSFTVLEVLPGSPAEECRRIHPGDRLIRVEGVEVEGKEPSFIESMIAGPSGSPLVLTLESAFDGERRSVKLVRKAASRISGILDPPQQPTDTPDTIPPAASHGPADPPATQAAKSPQVQPEEPAQAHAPTIAAASRAIEAPAIQRSDPPKMEPISQPAPVLQQEPTVPASVLLDMNTKIDQMNKHLQSQMQGLQSALAKQNDLMQKQDQRLQEVENRPQGGGCSCVIS